MEGVQRGPRDQAGLVRDPEVFDRVEGVGENDSLSLNMSTSFRIKAQQKKKKKETYPISHAHLKDRAVFLRPLGCSPRMFIAELNQISKDGDSGNLG